MVKKGKEKVIATAVLDVAQYVSQPSTAVMLQFSTLDNDHAMAEVTLSATLLSEKGTEAPSPTHTEFKKKKKQKKKTETSSDEDDGVPPAGHSSDEELTVRPRKQVKPPTRPTESGVNMEAHGKALKRQLAAKKEGKTRRGLPEFGKPVPQREDSDDSDIEIGEYEENMLRAGYMDADSLHDPFQNYEFDDGQSLEEQEALQKRNLKAAEDQRLRILKEEAVFDVDPNSAAVKLEATLATVREELETARQDAIKASADHEREKQQLADELMKSQLELANMAALQVAAGGMSRGPTVEADAADATLVDRLQRELRETRARLMASEAQVEEAEVATAELQAELDKGAEEQRQLKGNLAQAQTIIREQGSTKLAAAFSAPVLASTVEDSSTRESFKGRAAALRQKRESVAKAMLSTAESLKEDINAEREKLIEATDDAEAIDAIAGVVDDLLGRENRTGGAMAAARELLGEDFVSVQEVLQRVEQLQAEIVERDGLLEELQNGAELLGDTLVEREAELVEKEAELASVITENEEMFEQFQAQLTEMQEAIEQEKKKAAAAAAAAPATETQSLVKREKLPIKTIKTDEEEAEEELKASLRVARRRVLELEEAALNHETQLEKVNAESLELYVECDRLKSSLKRAQREASKANGPTSEEIAEREATQREVERLEKEIDATQRELRETQTALQDSEALKGAAEVALEELRKRGGRDSTSNASPEATGSEAIMREAIEQACRDRDRSKHELKDSLAERDRLKEELAAAQRQHEQERDTLETKLAGIKFEAAQARAENEDLKWDLKEALGGGSGLQGDRPNLALPQMQHSAEESTSPSRSTGWFG